jgi:predicted nuclease of predicted toxin-antitoxin system
MKGFLLDENLPTRLTFAPSMPTCHARHFGGNPTDGELWELARVRHWVIITKDADFSERILVSKAPPWIVRLRLREHAAQRVPQLPCGRVAADRIPSSCAQAHLRLCGSHRGICLKGTSKNLHLHFSFLVRP